MAPIPNQGSRTGLITALVIFALLSTIASIAAIYQGVQNTKLREEHESYRKKYNGVVSEAGINSPTTEALRGIRDNPDLGLNLAGSATVIDVAWSVANRLAQTISGEKAGEAGEPGNALIAGPAAIASASKRLDDAKVDVKLPENLIGALSSATDALLARQQQVTELNKGLADASKAVEAAKAELVAFSKAKDAEVAAARDEAAQVASAAQADRASNVAASTDAAGAFTSQADQFTQNISTWQAKVTDLNRQVTKLTRERDEALARVGRATNTSTALLRQGDGAIVRLAGDSIAYVNLGAGDQIAPGLTFEVYDRLDGIPDVDTTDPAAEALPQGKASIEITRVGATSSEARVIRLTPGMQLTEGDIISNLIYDPNVKFGFVVYGDFDLDGNGNATPADANLIKQLVTNWGGQVTDVVNVNTDFVIMGTEPKLPTFDREDLNDPINRKRLEDAQASLTAFNAVVTKAQGLGVPILNQNRFLYLVGYYDQAKR